MMHLFLSPHFDDAILSCGGLIHHLAQQGADVQILTVMGGDIPQPLPDTPIVRDLHQRWDMGYDPIAARRKEERCAANVVGATTRYLKIPDCIYRVDESGAACYPTEDSLWDKIHPDDRAIKWLLSGNWQAPVIDHITYIPLGVGGHVDHLLVRQWSMQTNRRLGQKFKFYAEYPYTRDKSAMDKALRRFDVRLKSIPHPLTEDDMNAKIEAIRCYESQISTFWQDADAMSAAVREHFAEGESIWMMDEQGATGAIAHD